MRGKEFLIQNISTMEGALAQLFDEMFSHLKDKPAWEWRKFPEVMRHDKGWSAYARIVYK